MNIILFNPDEMRAESIGCHGHPISQTPQLDRLAAEGVQTVQADICRIESEFQEAMQRSEHEDVDLIITLHLAYSPSLESIQVLAATRRPILILDTTMDFKFGPDVDPTRIMFNHGIHGVQDLACMLRRKGIPFEIVAGHIRESNVLQRAAGIARAAYAARCLKNTKALRIGNTFKGMGDFAVSEQVLQEVLGISVDEVARDALTADVERISENEIEEEMRDDHERYAVDIDEEVHRRSVRVGLGRPLRQAQGVAHEVAEVLHLGDLVVMHEQDGVALLLQLFKLFSQLALISHSYHRGRTVGT